MKGNSAALFLPDSLESLTFTQEKNEKGKKGGMFADFGVVLLLLDVVDPRGDGVGGRSEEVKDALEHGLHGGTGFGSIGPV